MALQQAFDQIEVAAEVANKARKRFLPPEADLEPSARFPAAVKRIKEYEQRLSLLQLKTRIILKACSIELKISIGRQAPSVDPEDLPDDLSHATALVERFAADAKQAFKDLTYELGRSMNANLSLFMACAVDLLQYLNPANEDYWAYLSSTTTMADRYKWTLSTIISKNRSLF